jgi:methionine-rich copper-binding protein CopC
MKKLLVGFGVAVLFLLGTATPALAHNVLISTDPANGTSMATGPAKVSLTFDQYVQDANVNQVAVTGPGGQTQWAESPVRVTDNVVSAQLRPLGPAGEYTIGFRVLSADGHPVTGEVKFTLTQAGTGTPVSVGTANLTGSGTANASGGSTGIPIWVWIVGAVILLGVGLTVALRAGRESTKS